MRRCVPGERDHDQAVRELTSTCRDLPSDELRAQADAELQALEAAFAVLQKAYEDLKEAIRDVVAGAP